jgi:GDPmannose 4,6-dehydratase
MKAFITGVTGQDGYYLTKFLQSRNYDVVGLARRVSTRGELPDCEIIAGDITDATAIAKIVARVKPQEIYNLAAQSHVGESFKCPGHTWDVNARGALNVLEAAKDVGAAYYQASTSELFGISHPPQSETTPHHPRSPYAVAKSAAYWATINYREAYRMRTANGILFNHESPRRGKDFVTQKVCRHAASVKNGNKEKLKLGNLEAKRDWGHAQDYVQAMWLALQVGGEYVVATGENFTIRDLCEVAYSTVGENWKNWVVTDKEFVRPAEVPDLRGNPRKMEALGWKREYDFYALITEMVDHALHTTA